MSTVLIPGLLGTARFFAGQIPALAAFGPVTVADLADADSIAALAHSVLAAAPPRFALAGASMGGYVALEIMRLAPERVTRLALLDTSARPDTPVQRKARLGQIARVQDGGDLAGLSEDIFPFVVHPSRHDDDALRAVVCEMAIDTGPDAFLRQQQAILGRPDSRPSLSAIQCPTLVLVGDEDLLAPPEHAMEIADAIARAKLVVVPQCGHLSPLEQPAAVAAALVTWLGM